MRNARSKPFAVPKSSPERTKKQEENAAAVAVQGPEVDQPVAADVLNVSSESPDRSRVPPLPKRTLPPEEFFRYWASIPKRERDEWFIVYVYRGLPICDVTQTMSEEELSLIARGKKEKPAVNIAILTEPLSPENYEQEILSSAWGGAGDYGFRLNDQHPSVKKTICFTTVGGKNMREWDSYPPVLNPAEVVLTEKDNAGYIRWARLKGIVFPGDPGYTDGDRPSEEEDEMAANATVEKLTDALIDATSRPPQQHQGPVLQTESSNSRAAEVVASAAMEGQKIITEALKISQSTQAKAADPAEHTKAVIEMARLITAPAVAPGPSMADMVSLMNTMMAPVLAANAAILEESRARAAAAEKRAEALEQRLMAPVIPPAVAPEVANPVRNAIDLLKGLVSLKDTAGSLLGGGDGLAADADMPVWARLGSKALDVLPGMLHNAAVLRSGQGQPVPPEELSSEVIEAETKQVAAPLEQVKQEDESVITDRRMAQEIAAPLIKALNEGRKGFEFAAGMMSQGRIMGFPGRVVYEMAVEQGENGMIRILQSYPQLWQQLVRIPTQFGKFLAEFLDRNAAYQVLEQVQAEQRAATAPSPVPVNGSVDSEPVQVMTPTIEPPVKHRGGGRTVVNPADGKPIHTAPVVDTTTL